MFCPHALGTEQQGLTGLFLLLFAVLVQLHLSLSYSESETFAEPVLHSFVPTVYEVKMFHIY